MMDVTRQVMTAASRPGEYSAPVNQFHRMRDFVDPDFKNVVRISRSSLWATAFLDLDAEPLVFSHPAPQGHYLVAQIMDMWTDNFASLGTRTTGEQSGRCLITGPNWQGTAPPDIDATYRCDTRYAWILAQIAATDAREFPEVHALQDALKIAPLSAWGDEYAPAPESPVDPEVDTTAVPFDQVRLMDGPAFFQRLAAALKDNPPRKEDGPMRRKLRWIGLESQKEFDADQVDPATARGLSRAAKKIWGLLESAPYQMKTVNGWLLPLNLGRYGTDYDTRAFVAFVGLGALWSEDAIYPSAFVDGDGRPLDGACDYRIHFDKGGLFPSHSDVWSISVYRENFYVRNPVERYGITSGTPVQYNPDGSFDVYIQARSPGPGREANWLPCPPSGPFNVTVRVYQPEQAMLDGRAENQLMVQAGSYRIPPIQRMR
ncbi:DUF1254 domain-containing protein [Streptomyces sp. 2A115]|uniref:DUF1254 domain-containing protein n=1 Tax=Streptomyces sp. 2A115 TaxID=3457439 RepID=UPI003FD3D797